MIIQEKILREVPKKFKGLGTSSFNHAVSHASQTLREKCPNTEFFVVRIFAVFSPNTEKYGPEETPYWDTFHEVKFLIYLVNL